MGGVERTARAMKLYLAGCDPQHHSWAQNNAMRLRILLSYWYYKDQNLDELFEKYFTEPYPEVFADSGGFSAFTQGAQIDVIEYADWLHRWKHLITTAANLDVIGNHDATMENQHRLESCGLDVIPVFHAGSDYECLKELVGDYAYIALGGLVPHAKNVSAVMSHVIKCFKIADGRSVFHGFGVTTWSILKSFAWYSVDSSTWGRGFKFGEVPVFDSRGGKFVRLRLGKMSDWKRHGKLVSSLGFNPLDFADRSRNDRAKICAISALSYMKAEQWLRKRHGDIVIPGNENRENGINLSDADSGLKIHLAEGGGIGDTSRAMEILR